MGRFRYLAVGLGALISTSAWSAPAERWLILDDDNGMARESVARRGVFDPPSAPFTDPDGGLELAYLLGSRHTHLLGVTCVMGTVHVETCVEANRALLAAAGRTDIPVLRGATDASLLGQSTEAARFIIDQVRSHPGQVEILASAPLTNIATAVLLDPELPRYWKTLFVLSGEFSKGSDVARTEAWVGGDLNLSVDYPAAVKVFTGVGKTVVLPNEIQDDVLFSTSDMSALQNGRTPLPRYLYAELHGWFQFISVVFFQNGFFPHGMTGVAAALDPFYRGDIRRSTVQVIASGKPTLRHPWGSVRTEFVSDPTLPTHEIVMTFKDAELFRNDYRRRLRAGLPE